MNGFEIGNRRPVAAWAMLVACLGAALFFHGSRAAAAPADLDRSFGGGSGLEEVDFRPPGRGFVGEAKMALGPKGEIIVVERVQRFCSTPCGDLLLFKYGRGGQPDPRFSATFGLDIAPGRTFDLMVDGRGRVLVAVELEGKVQIVRLTADGALDSGFGVGGRVVLGADRALSVSDLAIGPNGRILLAANLLDYGPSDLSDAVVFGMTANGQSDRGFGGGSGFVVFDSQATDSAGELALVGSEIALALASGPDLRVLRLGPHGAIRAVSRPKLLGRSNWFLGPILAMRAGGARVVGWSGGGAAIGGFRRNWGRARAFGTNGSVFLPGFTSPIAASDRADRISLGTVVSNRDDRGEEFWRPRIVRRLSNGAVDRTFAGGRPVSIAEPEREVTQLDMGIQPNGKIVVLFNSLGLCVRGCESPSYFLVRLHGGASRASCGGRRATVVGTRRSETIVGTRHRDVIAGLGGSDRIVGRGGDDLICGGRGADTIKGGRGRDRLFGGRGVDAISGGPGRDRQRQ